MASQKEAIAIVLDTGPSMNQSPAGECTYLQTSLAAINMILQRKLFAESKDEVALILFGTQDTANELSDGESYENVTLGKPLAPVSWDLLQYIQNDIQPSNVSGDFLDAMVVAMDHVMKNIQGKRGFVSKRLILFSDVGGEFGDDKLNDILGAMKEAEIELNVIGPDLDADEDDDDQPGMSNGDVKEKTPQQRAGEALLKHVIEQTDGESYSFSEALPALSYFQSRQVRPTAWKCQLDVGDNLKIPIQGFIKVKEAKPKSFKNVYAKDPDSGIQRLKTFHLNDDAETEIEDTETVQGLRYGNTLVPFSKDDMDVMKFKAEKCFKVLGFTKTENVRRNHFLGDSSMVVVAEKGDEPAAVALSALVNAMYETNTVAIVRRVYNAAASPRIGCLAPHIKASHECLYYNELPFAEDVRQFTFGSLPVKDDSNITNKKFIPSDDQLKTIDNLIDAMDLSNAVKDDDDEPQEALKPKLIFNPFLQRLYQCLQHRALNPDDPLPELSEVVSRSLEPPREVKTKCEATVEKMQDLFKLTVVAKKKEDQTGEKMFKDDDKEADGPAAKRAKIDDDLGEGMADLAKAKVKEVGTVNPVNDFRAIIGQKDEDRFEEACDMMSKRISQIVTDSFGSQFYSKAMDCLKELRSQCIKNSESELYNTFMKTFKDQLVEKGRKDFWQEIVSEKAGLISKLESEDSKVSNEDAQAFLQGEAEPAKEEKKDEPAEDVDDLLDQM